MSSFHSCLTQSVAGQGSHHQADEGQPRGKTILRGNIDTPLDARLPGDQKSQSLDGQPAWGKKRFVEEADVDSRTSQEDVVSLASGERKGLATMKGGSRGGQLIGTSPSGGSRLVVDVISYRKRRAGNPITYIFL